MNLPALPPGANLDSLERLGKIVNQVGVPLLLVFFLLINMGWLSSPLTHSIEYNTKLNVQILERLAEHERRVEKWEEVRSREVKDAFATIQRLTELLKIIDCAAIQDPKLRDRCLGR